MQAQGITLQKARDVPKQASRSWRRVALLLFAVTLLASAYPVYHNAVSHLPVSVGFFWFSLFATVTTFAYPQNLNAALQNRNLSAVDRWRLLYPRRMLGDWFASFAKGGLWLLALSGIAYSLYFAFLLLSLKVPQVGVVVTILVLQQMNPLVAAFGGYVFLGDTCRSWSAYIVGTLVTGAGIILYKRELTAMASITFFDTVVWLVMAVIAFDMIYMLARARYSKQYSVDALDVMRSTQIIATTLGFLWMALEQAAPWITMGECAALVYLGFVPTAVAGIIMNRVQDKVGIPLTRSIHSLRPLLLFALAALPFSWFSMDIETFTATHFFGITLAISGLLIIYWIARPEPVK